MSVPSTTPYFKKLAKQLRDHLAASDAPTRAGALERIRRALPGTQGTPDDQLVENFRHGDALNVIAAEGRAASWQSASADDRPRLLTALRQCRDFLIHPTIRDWLDRSGVMMREYGRAVVAANEFLQEDKSADADPRRRDPDDILTERLRSNSSQCPFCGCEELDADDYDGASGEHTQRVECGDCGRTWTEGYTFTWAKLEEEDFASEGGVQPGIHLIFESESWETDVLTFGDDEWDEARKAFRDLIKEHTREFLKHPNSPRKLLFMDGDQEIDRFTFGMGESPDPFPVQFEVGDRVHWRDPGDDLGSGPGTITRIQGQSDDEYFPIVSDTLIVIRRDNGSEAEVLPGELTHLAVDTTDDSWDNVEARIMDGAVSPKEWDSIETRAMDGAIAQTSDDTEDHADLAHEAVQAGRDPNEVNPVVHLVGWVYGAETGHDGLPDGGGGGFNWFFQPESADKAFAAELENTRSPNPDNWIAYQVAVRVSSFQNATDEIDAELPDIEARAIKHGERFIDLTGSGTVSTTDLNSETTSELPTALFRAEIAKDRRWTPWRIHVARRALELGRFDDLAEVSDLLPHEDACARRGHSAAECTCIVWDIRSALSDAGYDL